MDALDTTRMTDDEIGSTLKSRTAQHRRLATVSTGFMLGILVFPVVAVASLALAAPGLALAGFMAGLLGAVASFAMSEAFNIGALHCEKDIRDLEKAVADRGAAPAAQAGSTPALSSQLSPSFDAARQGPGENPPLPPPAPLRRPTGFRGHTPHSE